MDQELQHIERSNDARRARRIAGSRRTVLHMLQRAAGGRPGRHLESMTSYQKIRLSQSMRNQSINQNRFI